MSKPDKLDEIFHLQQALNLRIGVDMVNMTEEERKKWMLNYCRAMSQEIAELTDSVPWKWWAKYQKFDKQNARVEVIDLLHFLISIAQVLEMTPEERLCYHNALIQSIYELRQAAGVRNDDSST